MRILCLGNGDNVGVRVYLKLKNYKQNVKLYRLLADEDPQRGNPYLYFSKDQVDKNNDIKPINDDLLKIRNISLFSSKATGEINDSFDIVFITGGWHALIYSRKIKLPKIFIPVGYEIHRKAREYKAIPNMKELFLNFRQTIRNYFYGWLTRNSLSKVTKILDWFPPTVAVNKSLGFEDKILYMAFGEDLKKNKALVKKELLQELNFLTASAKRVFLWFSRVNFLDPNKANYKGADLFIKALKQQESSLSTGELLVYMGLHGEEVNEFKEFVKKSSVHKYIRWINHLEYPELMAYLSINNAVLFTDFGEVNAGISGIGRDGYAMGIPMVNSTTDEIMVKQYTFPGPRTYANTEEEIATAMKEFIFMNEEDFSIMKKRTSDYGKQYIDQSFFVKRLLKAAHFLMNHESK
ncbi:MAG: hypothetical protein NTW22_07660 [Proteobacteria bacterium]|nr:hypothetical protein [Pseudomonadota bacterium]